MEMRIGARNKAGYLSGETKKLEYGDPNLGAWITENQRVKSWLIDSMSPWLIEHGLNDSMSPLPRRYGRPYQKHSMMDQTKPVFLS